jgi:hypothetical protein
LHIDTLVPQRDELIAEASNQPFGEWVQNHSRKVS